MKAEDILNNTDPQELRNLIWRLRRMLDGSQRPPPTTIVIQAPGQYPPLLPTLGPNRVVITNGAGTITSDESLEYIQGPTYVVGSEISTGTVNANDADGVEITGLTPWDWYVIEATGGPWHSGVESGHYEFDLSTDGITFSGRIGKAGSLGYLLVLPSFAAYAEAIDENYGRVYFQATGTSVWFRVNDSTHGDNTGTLGYRLLNGIVGVDRITLDDVEYTQAKLPSAIHTATAKTTPADADEFVLWDSVVNLLKKITWSSIKAALKTYFDTLYSVLGHTHSYLPTDADYSDISANDAATDVTGAELEELTNGSETTLHSHAAVTVGQYRQFVWVDDGAGSWEFVSSGGQPVLNLQDLE